MVNISLRNASLDHNNPAALGHLKFENSSVLHFHVSFSIFLSRGRFWSLKSVKFGKDIFLVLSHSQESHWHHIRSLMYSALDIPYAKFRWSFNCTMIFQFLTQPSTSRLMVEIKYNVRTHPSLNFKDACDPIGIVELKLDSTFRQSFQTWTIHWTVKEGGSRFLKSNRDWTGIEPRWHHN